MLSSVDNDYVTRVGPGTPMGTLMREYWIPALLSSELPAPDSDPVRVMLLGEQLIGFRDTSGKVGLIQNLCPHRGASLFYGRNEQGGLRCVYHGWKYDTEGNCTDMPNEPAESNFKSKIHATAYPCQERAGIIWTYMGPRETPPPLPRLSGNAELDEGEWEVSAFERDCNWLQALEGDIDTAHTNWLHSGSMEDREFPENSIWAYALRDRGPQMTVLDTDYGCIYGAHRPAAAGETYWRVTQFLMPFHIHLQGSRTRAWVPMDDHHVLAIMMNSKLEQLTTRAESPDTPAKLQRARSIARNNPLVANSTDWFGRFRPEAAADNDYLIDRSEQRSGRSFSGIPNGFTPQDQAVTESMGPVLDRTIEHLGVADTMVIKVRARLLEAARGLLENKAPAPAVDEPDVYWSRGAGRIIMPEAAGLLDASAELDRKPTSNRDQEIDWHEVDRT